MEHRIGTVVPMSELSFNSLECQLIKSATRFVRNAYCPLTNSPVGCAIFAQRNDHRPEIFSGCNVECAQHFPATGCAERVATFAAVVQGFKEFLSVAVAYPSLPGRLPCGICRQLLAEFGRSDATFLTVAEGDTVRRLTVGDLLPAATGPLKQRSQLDPYQEGIVEKVLALKAQSPVPEPHHPRGACVLVPDSPLPRIFDGLDGFHGRGAANQRAERVAMELARLAGFTPKNAILTLAVTVADPTAPNPINGESLYVLDQHEANDAIIWLIGPDGSLVVSSLRELYPQ